MILYASDKAASETITITVNVFKLTNTPSSPYCSVESIGPTVDPNPSSILNGAAFLTGSDISQHVTGGIAGCVYMLSFWFSAPNGDRFREQVRLEVTT